MVRVTCFSLQVRREPAQSRCEQNWWVEPVRVHIIWYNTSDCESGKETLCIHSFHNVFARSIARAIACGALLYQPYCKCPKFGPKIGWAMRSWPSRRPTAFYECFFEQWARIFGRVMTRPTRPVPPGLLMVMISCFQSGTVPAILPSQW